MSSYSHRFVFVAALSSLILSGCATTPSSLPALATGSQVMVEGTITAIDTQPWTYDGNAVVLLDTAAHGRVPVQLPARWNLCKAPPVDVTSLAVGQRVQVTGTAGAENEVVVCEGAAHRITPTD